MHINYRWITIKKVDFDLLRAGTLCTYLKSALKIHQNEYKQAYNLVQWFLCSFFFLLKLHEIMNIELMVHLVAMPVLIMMFQGSECEVQRQMPLGHCEVCTEVFTFCTNQLKLFI